MSTTESALDLAAEPAPIKWRQYAVILGRIGLALALLAAWKIGADRAGPLYVADPVKVAQRIVEDLSSGELLRHIYVTLRLATIGFAIGRVSRWALPVVRRG